MNKLITFIISLIVLAPTAEAQTQREIGKQKHANIKNVTVTSYRWQHRVF